MILLRLAIFWSGRSQLIKGTVREGCDTMFGGWNYGNNQFSRVHGSGQAGIFTLSRWLLLIITDICISLTYSVWDILIKAPRHRICAIVNWGKIMVEPLGDNSWMSCGFSEKCWSEALHWLYTYFCSPDIYQTRTPAYREKVYLFIPSLQEHVYGPPSMNWSTLKNSFEICVNLYFYTFMWFRDEREAKKIWKKNNPLQAQTCTVHGQFIS